MPEWKLDRKAILITNTITTDQWNLEDSRFIETRAKAKSKPVWMQAQVLFTYRLILTCLSNIMIKLQSKELNRGPLTLWNLNKCYRIQFAKELTKSDVDSFVVNVNDLWLVGGPVSSHCNMCYCVILTSSIKMTPPFRTSWMHLS